MNAEKMKRHISHLEEKHHKLDHDIDIIEHTGHAHSEDIHVTDLKKERLHLKDEIERCRHQLESMLK